MMKNRIPPPRSRPSRSQQKNLHRMGSILLMSTAVLILILGFVVFSIDVGYIALSKGQLQNAVDAAALGAVQELNPNIETEEVVANATQVARDIAAMHRAGDHANVSIEGNLGDVEFGRRTFDLQTGKYNYEWGPDATPFNAVKVTARRTAVLDQQGDLAEDNQLPLFFGPILGASGATLQTSAIATFQPRDIMLVLDYSGSMNDDSELKSIGVLGQAAVEDNIHEMWQDLGSPTYGNMDFVPDWVTIPGQPAAGPVPHITVKWRSSEIDVTSTKDLSNVVMEFSNGNRQKIEGLTSPTGTFKGTGGNNGQRITRCWIKSGRNACGDGPGYGEKFDFYNNSHIRKGLGLDGVPYPYPSGSWDDYIEYARSHASGMPWYDSDVYAAGYRRKFGMLTLINFWNKNKPKNSQTPGLWRASQQPITALKDSVDLLIDYLVGVAAEDNVGLSVYNSPSGDALLELNLGSAFDTVKTTSRQRQAGHYDSFTNIGAGM
ncbi:MAG: hypothetical protein KDA84_25595, partial [Planctomycetaceae bacterium]|nr:hypothetical protein [Planctomycetaceae bacterium]